MRPEIRRLTPEQLLSLLASVRPSLTRRITAVHLHHTWRPTRAQFRGLASIEGMRNYHIGLGWDDIAQHLTIDPVGICWTGRNWNLPPASQKGKNGTPDAGPFMIEMVGDFDAGQDVLDGEQRRPSARSSPAFWTSAASTRRTSTSTASWAPQELSRARASTRSSSSPRSSRRWRRCARARPARRRSRSAGAKAERRQAIGDSRCRFRSSSS